MDVLFVLLLLCSDEEITHELDQYMICDVHFGDTRNDITPANNKRLPNNHPEEQQTNNKKSKFVMKMTMQAMQFYNTNTHETFSTLICGNGHMSIQVRLEEGKDLTCFVVLLL